jgi:nitric oxide synthase-interacting protein
LFEQCGLCLKLLEEPIACSKGHIFCKTCIIENMISQKAEIKRKIKEWEEDMKSRLTQTSHKDIIRKTEQLKEYEDKIVELDTIGTTVQID